MQNPGRNIKETEAGVEKILKRARDNYGVMWSGLNWLKIGFSGRILRRGILNFRVPRKQRPEQTFRASGG